MSTLSLCLIVFGGWIAISALVVCAYSLGRNSGKHEVAEFVGKLAGELCSEDESRAKAAWELVEAIHTYPDGARRVIVAGVWRDE